MNTCNIKTLSRIIVGLVLFITIEISVWLGVFDFEGGLWVQFVLFFIDYLIVGVDIVTCAARNIVHGKVFDEHFLMSIASLGAFALVFFPDAEPHMAEGVVVVLFYQIGEFFQDRALNKSRAIIAAMADIVPEYANINRDGKLVKINPNDVSVGQIIVVKPGERVPLDGTVVEGHSQLDTSALTGESALRSVEMGTAIASGCINISSVLRVRVERPFAQSSVQRILELVEKASERKAHTENFITRFAHYYTPVVVGIALVIAIVPPLFGGLGWEACVQSALIFAVVSCPCALIIGVPLTFFCGIGASSKRGILVKGSSYLEALARVKCMVFDKTGTLTNGSFEVVAVHSSAGVDPHTLLSYTAHAEAYSDHPIALSVKESYSAQIDQARIEEVRELAGLGISAKIDEHLVLVGNDKLMDAENIDARACKLVGTILHVALDGKYIGHIVIADVVKADAAECIAKLHDIGIARCVMLTGDHAKVAQALAQQLAIDEYHAELLPADKVACVERLLLKQKETSVASKLAFVGDGINDAPALARADIGIAMGAMGSEAAIEAADIVLMDDQPSKLLTAITIARKTMRIVWQNIIFALAVKITIMVLALPFIGIATIWLAVFGDVGVTCLAVLNATRALRVSKKASA